MIHAIGLLPAEARRSKYPPGKLEEARDGLLRLLVKGLSAEAAHQTTVVFDALEPPEFLPDSYRHAGMRILFARDYRDADELIIELILKQARSAPLTVVSSDHRIQAAARRRKASVHDSDRWYFGDMPVELSASPGSDTKPCSPMSKDEKKNHNLSPEEQAYWEKIFLE